MIEIEAIFESGVLRPLDLVDRQRVRVSIFTELVDATSAVALQRRAMDELDAELVGVPDKSPADDFSAADHDAVLYR